MKNKNKTVKIILYAVALGMGIATIVLSILGQPVSPIFLGIGVAALALQGLDSIDEE